METYALANCFILFSIASLQERRVHQQLFKVSDMFCDFLNIRQNLVWLNKGIHR